MVWITMLSISTFFGLLLSTMICAKKEKPKPAESEFQKSRSLSRLKVETSAPKASAAPSTAPTSSNVASNESADNKKPVIAIEQKEVTIKSLEKDGKKTVEVTKKEEIATTQQSKLESKLSEAKKADSQHSNLGGAESALSNIAFVSQKKADEVDLLEPLQVVNQLPATK
ncbi:hypothetical protein M3Y94_00479100 [Aphelenchoides besseyi]|nr:hypothetical protein M3Y94_00479100 [Aphelenchoides besseyi]